jgi:ATP-dependent Clp protease ATP-binding subunit ClpB
MLQVLDPGRLTDPIGRAVSFEDAIVIFTTNIGQTHFLGYPSFEEASGAAAQELNATYRSEFLNRFNGRQNIICFRTLGIESIKKIVDREIHHIDEAYHNRGVRVVMPDDAQDALCIEKYDPAIGGRGLPGYISANLEPELVKALLDGRSGLAQVGYVAHEGFSVTW